MNVDTNRLAHQVKLAYEFIETLHGQALALIKDVETQLAQATEELQCLRPGGYRFTINPQTFSFERPQPTIANYYAVCFRHSENIIKKTPIDGNVPPIALLKIVLRERNLEHPEVRFGIITEVSKPEDYKWPKKFEDVVSRVVDRVLTGSLLGVDQETVQQNYQDNHISLSIRGKGIRLADLPDSEAIAEKIIDPLLMMYREAIGER